MPNEQLMPSLQGCRIALITAADDAYTPANQLRDREAALLFYPASQTLPPDSYDELDAALSRCQRGEVDWLLLTTPCAVEAGGVTDGVDTPNGLVACLVQAAKAASIPLSSTARSRAGSRAEERSVVFAAAAK